MSRTIRILSLVWAILSTSFLSAEKKPQFAPLQSCYDGSITDVGKGVVPPRILHTVDPEYTEAARKAGIQGTVLVQVVLTPEGKLCPVKIVRGLTFELDQNAVKALEQWTFQSAQKDGKPVASKLDVEVVFRLY